MARNFARPQPSPALAELLAQTGELDRILEGRGLEFTSSAPEPAPEPPRSFVIPRPDREQERIERLEREAAEQRARLEQEVAAELAKITDDGDEPETRPARRRHHWREDTRP